MGKQKEEKTFEVRIRRVIVQETKLTVSAETIDHLRTKLTSDLVFDGGAWATVRKDSPTIEEITWTGTDDGAAEGP